MASTLDWTATILAAAGASPAPTHPPDGIDLLPILAGRAPEQDRTICWRMSQRTRQGAIRHGRWKYLRDEDGEYLFDLVLDPGERNGRKGEESERFGRLKEEYGAWERAMLAPVPVGE